ncbi:hypothetical protein M758_7G157600 [Ceratodon purpureus]|nr:hypothetical protein M758_7G157600 [Ceratodon purpureus]
MTSAGASIKLRNNLNAHPLQMRVLNIHLVNLRGSKPTRVLQTLESQVLDLTDFATYRLLTDCVKWDVVYGRRHNDRNVSSRGGSQLRSTFRAYTNVSPCQISWPPDRVSHAIVDAPVSTPS